MSSDSFTDLLGRTVSIGQPPLSIRRDLLDDPVELLTILHEYAHYTILTSWLGSTAVGLMMSCYCVQSVLNDLSLQPRSEDHTTQTLDVLQILVDTQLRLKALITLWAPFLEGFAVFSEQDVVHVNDLVTDVGYLVAELRSSGRLVLDRVSSQFQSELARSGQPNYEEIRGKVINEILQKLGDDVADAQGRAIRQHQFLVMTDTLQMTPSGARSSVYLSGYCYVRHLHRVLSEKDPRLRDPTFFWVFVAQLARSEFCRMTIDLMDLPLSEFLERLKEEVFDKFASLERVETDRLKEICDGIDTLREFPVAREPPYDSWTFISKGLRVPPPSDPGQAEREYCGRLIVPPRLRVKLATGDSYKETYHLSLAKVRDFLMPSTVQAYSYEDCTEVNVWENSKEKEVVFPISLRSGPIIMSLAPEGASRPMREFLTYVKSVQPAQLRFLQIIKFTPWLPRRYNTYMALACEGKLCLLPGQKLSAEEIQEMEERFSGELASRVKEVQQASSFSQDSLNKTVDELTKNTTKTPHDDGARGLASDVPSLLSQLDWFKEMTVKTYFKKALNIKDEATLDKFVEEGVLITCSTATDKLVLESLMTRASAASLSEISSDLSLNQSQVESSLTSLNSRSLDQLGYKIIDSSDGAYRYVRPGH